MPPKPKINRQMILDASFEIVREQGHEMINARTIAEKLGCSTQPVMYNFKTIEEIREETYNLADEYHTGFIMPKGDKGYDPLLELGMNYIRFGYEEKNLFRFLFQTNSFAGLDVAALMSNPGLGEMLRIVSSGAGCTEDEARNVFFNLFVSAHGIASLIANNSMEYEEESFRKVLENTYINLTNRGRNDEKII